jgi:hypothetical protein
MQYRSFKDSDHLSDVDWWEALVGSTTKREVAHFSFDAALVTSMPTGREAVL